MATHTFGAFLQGWGIALRHPTLVFLKWVVNLVFMFILVAPIRQLLVNDLESSLLSDDLFTGMSWSYVMEFTRQYEGELFGIRLYFLPLLVLFLVANLWLSGGILRAIQETEKRPKSFVSDCTANLLPLLLTLVLSLLLGFLLVVLPCMGWLKLMTWFNDLSWFGYKTVTWMRWIGLLLIICLPGSWVLRVYDYCRMEVCRREEGRRVGLVKTFGIFWKTLVFARRYHIATFVLLVLFAASHVGLVMLFNALSPLLPESTFVAFAATQLLIMVRVTASIATMAGQGRYAWGRLIPIAGASEPVAEPVFENEHEEEDRLYTEAGQVEKPESES